ncbi:DUF4123 domain-containing protein [Achromobacter arsenitoxydans]|uniref:DUF4123 domain-containing protein n=1 Tax=Achromobacter arsenitoxydans SY8 TaxID=477184 RepID=H0F0Q3_9BURK|nr:DUF4123 domain-containing protein [Achromobacter arsenitoxydans]EHK68160.1 hypothetical protein KYC_01674 [Achromobacter arsenitoxydans SY8]
MNAVTKQSSWSRQVVDVMPSLNWAMLQQGPRPWLCLDGACSETLEEDVQAVTKSLDYRWAWRGTAWEYSFPGYRQGPLLVPLDEALLTFALDHWLRQQAGLILQGPDDRDSLLAHLQQLHQLEGSDGLPIGFRLHAMRSLEELCEGLPDDRRLDLFGPIQRFIWHSEAGSSGEWLYADSPATNQSASKPDSVITLTPNDEDALDQASLAWFMRDCARETCQRIPAYGLAENERVLWGNLSCFVGEATDQLALTAECDVRRYVALRFEHPQEFFAKDAALREILVKKHLQGKQRLLEAEARLTTLASANS